MKKTYRLLFLAMIVAITTTGFICGDDGPSEPAGPPPLVSTTNKLTMMNGQQLTVKISGGNQPYEIKYNTDPEVTAIELNGGILSISSSKVGKSTITIQDASWPTQYTSIEVSSVSVIAVPGSGSLSFMMPGGLFAVSGPVAVSQKNPPSKDGVGALQWPGMTAVVGYKVHSPTNIDIVELDFHYASVLTTGTYVFAPAGNVVYAHYIKGINPYDTASTGRHYLMMADTAVVTSVSDTSILGTFRGIFTNVRDYNDEFPVTEGMFSVPVKRAGGAETGALEKLLERLRRERTPLENVQEFRKP